MNTLIVWNNGLNLAFFQVPATLVAPYMHVNGVCITKEHEDDQTHRTIEHLAVMLGEHEMATAGGSMPTLDQFLEARVGEKPKRKSPKRREKTVDAAWEQYRIGPNLEIDNCERILHTGWLDLDTALLEDVERSQNQEEAMAGVGGSRGSTGAGVGGDDRGEVKHPESDKRLKEHGGGNRGRQSGPRAGKGREGKKS
jgi:hypothetical protein